MLSIRRFSDSDGDHCLRLFRDTVRRINAKDYTATQILAWASDDTDAKRWISRFSGRHAYVAQMEGAIVGFSDMSSDGHLDRLFVSADHQRLGIGTALISQLLCDAASHDIDVVYTDASITARPFFAKMGFGNPVEQSVECRGSTFTNFRMTRSTTDNHRLHRSGGG